VVVKDDEGDTDIKGDITGNAIWDIFKLLTALHFVVFDIAKMDFRDMESLANALAQRLKIWKVEVLY